MKASLRWLREFVDLPDDPEVVAEALNAIGVEVETMEHLDLPFSGVIIARVLAVEAHPDADRIRVVTLDCGDRRVTVVCGAWNFDVGATVAYSPPGAVLSGGFVVGEKEIRGVMSPGMICSERELGLGDDSDGIVVLRSNDGELGAELASIVPLPDVVFDVSITSNRPDLMSTYGLARDLAAHFDVKVRHPEAPQVKGSGSPEVMVRVDDPERCPRFTAREIRGVTMGQAPLWMRTRLRSIGLRPVSNVVDITNYVMWEIGQPLHAFDLDRIDGKSIIVRKASAGESLTTLDHVDRTLTEEDLVIADAKVPIGLAGVIGGGDSEVTDSTTSLLLEVAHFEASRVLFTGKRHGIRSDALARFERGVDPELPPLASARATALILDLCGGEAVGDLLDIRAGKRGVTTVSFPLGEVERLLGVEIAPALVRSILERLGFGVTGDGPLTVTIPSFRPDVSRPADLVEEVARIYGFDQIPGRLARGAGSGLPSKERTRRWVRSALLGAGYHETLSLDFVAAQTVAAMGYPEDDPRARPLRVRNPVSDEHAHLRTSLMPGLLAGLRTNLMRNRRQASLFEVGTVFLPGSDVLPSQPMHVALAAIGGRDARDAVGVVDMVFASLGIDYELSAGVVAGMHPGRGAEILVAGTAVGVVGEIHPQVAAVWDLDDRVSGAEFAIDALVTHGPKPFDPPSSMPPVVFDLAFDLPYRVEAARLIGAVREAAGPLLETVVIFDVFSGPPLGEGRRSIALRLTTRHPDRTLTDAELAPVRHEIASRVAEQLDGRLRGG